MKTQHITEEQTLIYQMLTTSTGKHFLDSGDAYGRHWQKNQARTIEDFIAEDQATLYISKYENKLEAEVSISLFHYLSENLELDSICRTFNALPCDNWESDMFGVSKEGKEYLESLDATIKDDFNSFNWDSSLSQYIQYTLLDIDGTDYVALQIHGGCDIRGGYTDAKLFKAGELFGYEMADFEISRGDNRLKIDFRGGELDVYSDEWTDENMDLEGALAEFGEGEHQGEVYRM
jgi:hypothetical protein